MPLLTNYNIEGVLCIGISWFQTRLILYGKRNFLKKHYNSKTIKRKRAPKRSIEQFNRAVIRSWLLYKELNSKNYFLVLNDETYVKKDFSQIPGHQLLSDIYVKECLRNPPSSIYKWTYGSWLVLAWLSIVSWAKKTIEWCKANDI